MNEQYVEKRIREYTKRRIIYEQFAEAILNILKAVIEEEYPDIKIASYSKRAKEIESLRKKLRKDKYNEDSEITDLAGVRIITYSKKDIDTIAKIVETCFELDKENSIDKTNALGRDRVGYRGEHYVVLLGDGRISMPEHRKFKGLKCEIQITSLIAHTWSEITHEKGYKFDGELPQDLERRKNLLAGMLELADLEMDAYVEAFDNYVNKLEKEIEVGGLKYPLNTKTLQSYMAYKFPGMAPHVFRDIELILNELSSFGVNTIKELDGLISSELQEELNRSGWRSLDGIIRNILIIYDSDKYFSDVWNTSMSQMNKKNFELYKKYGVNIEKICREKGISVVS